jgi:ElaB/YqjD/DUF883 family membrane-anchored ribosome-binding protein
MFLKGEHIAGKQTMATNQGESMRKGADDKSSYDRLQEDVEAVKTDVSKLAGQITDTLNDLTSAGRHAIRRKYGQARSNVDTIMADVAKQGNAALETAQESIATLEGTLEETVQQRPVATIGLALGLGFLIGVTWRR